MNADMPFHHHGEDGARYTVDVIRDRRDESNPHYDVDLVRLLQGRFGEPLEQRLTLAEYDGRDDALAHQGVVEDTLHQQGLAGLGDAGERIRQEPMLYDGEYLFVTYPPDAEGTDRAAAHLLRFDGIGVQSEPLAAGAAGDMQRLQTDWERDWATGQLPDMPQPQRQAIGDTGFTRDEAMHIHDAEGHRWAAHLDGGDTSHWFAIVDASPDANEPYELRYFRALEGESGEFKHDSYPVMPLADEERESAWPLPSLEMYLQKGDVYMAQQFAHDVAENNGLAFPNPLDLPALNPEPDYYFGYGVGPNNDPSLEAVKTWMAGSERRFDTFTIAEYGMFEEARVDEQELDALMQTRGLEAAMNLAENMAVAGGYLDPHRADGRVFFTDDAPPDPFTTELERAMEREMQHDENQQDPEYSITAISADGSSHLDVTKEWGEREHAHLIIPQPDWDAARTHAEFANEMLEQDLLQGAMTYVELVGVEAGVIDPKRDDPRLFTEGPPDPFTTLRERELAQTVDITEMDTEPYTPVTLEPEAPDYPTMYREFAAEAAREREANAALEGSAWFEATFEKSETELLQPIHDTVNYGIVVQDADPWTTELAVEKYWREPNGYLGLQSVTLDTWDSDDEQGREQAEQARETLLEAHDGRGLEGMMHHAELMAAQNDWLDGDRVDPRLFTQGPPDRFETLAQQLENEINPYWNTDGEKIEDPMPQTGAENPYWRLDTLPVYDPDGEPLGHALHIVVYPGVERDPDAVGSPALAEDEPFRMLEMAHFETTEKADTFGKEFNGYLIPGLLDGPELAVEVARLEGLPVEWKTLEGDDLKAYQNAELTLTRNLGDWHPYNPNAEHDARIAAEGLYTDPIQQVVERDEPETASSTPELDF
jgi:hypothetical protein